MLEKKTVSEQERIETIENMEALIGLSYEEYVEAIKQEFLCKSFLTLGILSKRGDEEVSLLLKKLREGHMKTRKQEETKKQSNILFFEIKKKKEEYAKKEGCNVENMVFQKIWYKKTNKGGILLVGYPYEEGYKTKIGGAMIIQESKTPELFAKINYDGRI